MATFLWDKAHFFLWDIGNTETRDFYFDIKDLVCITLGILLPLRPLQQDRLDFGHSFMKWFGFWSFRNAHFLQMSHIRACHWITHERPAGCPIGTLIKAHGFQHLVVRTVVFFALLLADFFTSTSCINRWHFTEIWGVSYSVNYSEPVWTKTCNRF